MQRTVTISITSVLGGKLATAPWVKLTGSFETESTGGNFLLGLFTNTPTLENDMTLPTFEEPGWTGYTRKAYTVQNNTVGAGSDVFQEGEAVYWVGGVDANDEVKGCFLYNNDDSFVWAAAYFDQVAPISPGDPITVVLSFAYD